MDLMKKCSRCGIVQLRHVAFYWYKGRPKGECKSCTKYKATERQKQLGRYPESPKTRKRRYVANKALGQDGRTEASFLQKFSRRGLTLDQYHARAEQLDFLCAICGEEPMPQNDRQGNVDNYVIDHDHQTNRFRDLTCWTCNAALGNLRDSPELARKAATYLDKHHSLRPA